MKTYKEVNLSLKDKLKLLFFDILPENILSDFGTSFQNNLENSGTSFQNNALDNNNLEVDKESINNNEEFNIPFFELDDNEDKKSNF